MTDPHKPWQPDERKLGNWTAMFDPQQRDVPPPAQSGAFEASVSDDAETPGIDLTEYRPWQLQRGRSRPAFMLALRRFDAKAGFWRGWSMAYRGGLRKLDSALSGFSA